MASPTPTTPIARRSSSPLVGRLTTTSPDPQIEILFTLPSVRIISFTTSPKPSLRPGASNGAPSAEDESGTLSWASRFERTIAVGPLRIYRAPGSVAFLNCVNALRPILPKSQAWCVDGNSKFVLQIRPPQYWRIEVPNNTEDENRMIEELKRVLQQVLRYEKTACPFQRDFVVQLPEKPQTPIKKRPWRPVARIHSEEFSRSSPQLQVTGSENKPSHLPISESRLLTTCVAPGLSASVQGPSSLPTHLQDTQYPVGKSEAKLPLVMKEVGISSTHNSNAAESTEPGDSLMDPVSKKALKPSLTSASETEYTLSSYAEDEECDSCSDATDDTNLISRSSAKAQTPPSENDSGKNRRSQSMQDCSRSATAPPQLSLVTGPPSRPRTHSPLRCSTSFETSSNCSSSVESFHSTESWHSPLAPPSPPAFATPSPTSAYPYPHENIVLPKRHVHSSDTSELDVMLESCRVWDTNVASSTRSTPRSLSPPPRTPPTLFRDGSDKSDEEPSEIATPPTVKSSIRHRATTSSNSRRRALSPLPAAVNLFSPRQRQRHLRTSRHLPTAIIQKTYEILLSPPSHLFSLMISIASKIAAREWRGVLSGHGEAVHWDFEDEYGSNSSNEDDYGVSLAKGAPAKEMDSCTNVPGGSWEVD
ncbi:hypothetical protein PZA11_004992 [Diplocarpon coronariae]